MIPNITTIVVEHELCSHCNHGQLLWNPLRSMLNFRSDHETRSPKEMCVLITPVPHHYHPGKNMSSNSVMKMSPSGEVTHTLIVAQSQQTGIRRVFSTVLLSWLTHGVKTLMTKRGLFVSRVAPQTSTLWKRCTQQSYRWLMSNVKEATMNTQKKTTPS